MDRCTMLLLAGSLLSATAARAQTSTAPAAAPAAQPSPLTVPSGPPAGVGLGTATGGAIGVGGLRAVVATTPGPATTVTADISAPTGTPPASVSSAATA